ncbi:MAG: hypothetical protein AAB797_00775 [Patescibacteria group bacterium]
MLVQYFTAFAWGIIVLFAFIGYGRLLNIILSPAKKFDLGMQAAFGLCLSVIVGGFLNFAAAISPLVLKAFVGFGFLLFLFFWLLGCQAWPLLARQAVVFVKANKIFSIAAALVFVIILVRYSSAVSFFGFNGSDDHHGYMAFPAKMLQTGSLGNDPFSERRVESSLGGQYFLHAMILSVASFKNLHLADNGLGYLILALLLVGFLKEKKVNRGIIFTAAVLMILLDSPVLNITAAYTAAAVFFLFFRLSYQTAEFKNNSSLRNALLVGLPLATLCVLKSTFVLVSVMLFFGHYYLCYQRLGDWRPLVKEFVLSILIIFIFLLPWMLAMLASSGTLLYPIFGRGYHGTAYDDFKHVIRFDLYSLLRLFYEGFNSLITLIPLVAMGVAAYVLAASEEKRFVWLIFFSSLSGVLALVLLLGGYSLYYYSFPYLLPTILFAAVLLLGDNLRFNRLPDFNTRLTGLLFVVFLIGAFLQRDYWIMQRIKDGLSIGDGKLKIGLMNSDLVSEAELKQYADLQKAVPAGETIIARLDRNFLFDFNRNQVYINDVPRGASLPPGLPLKSGSEAMANYFLSHNLKYIAYSYGNEANFARSSVSGMLKAHVNPLLRAITENGLAFQDYTIELSKTRKIIYDDGKNFVLDLSIKVK